MSISLKSLIQLLAALFLSSGFSRTSTAQTVVVPGFDATVEGNTAMIWPFEVTALPEFRQQQVYGASAFSALTGPSWITKIAFRLDGAYSTFAYNNPSIQINFSTTTKAPDGLSLTLSSNVGANDTVVFSGPINASGSSATTPRAFNFIITLTTPFLYDPAAGNLLFDVRNFTSDILLNLPLDAESTIGDDVSRAWTYRFSGGVATGRDTVGLVTQFTFVPAVPEPSTYGLLAVITLIAGVIYQRRKR